MKTSVQDIKKNFLAGSHRSPFSGPGNSRRKCSGLFPNIISDHLKAENPLCPRPPGTLSGLPAGQGHRTSPHWGCGKDGLCPGGLGWGAGGDRRDPCERVRHTNITKISQRQTRAPVRIQVQTWRWTQGPTSGEREAGGGCVWDVRWSVGAAFPGRSHAFTRDSPRASGVSCAAGECGSPQVSLLGNTVLMAQGVWGTT